ncbi:MAG: amidohydrolase family protein [Sphingobacteriia bacterium]|nr:amidohydrolase family protein [Sphingobacteriia bacterium]
MNYQKFSADQIFTGLSLLTGQSVLITDQKGTILDLISLEDAGDDVQHFRGILSPGFINAHCHLELSHMRGLIPEHTGLTGFILKIIGERHFPEEEILDAIAAGEAEMLAGGIVAVGDISNNALTVAQKQLNRLAYYNFIEVSGWVPAIADPRFNAALQISDQFSTTAHPFSVSPHAPYSVSNELWERIQPGFAGNTITIHNQETPGENELFKTGTGDFIGMYNTLNIDQRHFTPTGKSSLQSYFPRLASAKKIISVHNTLTDPADIVFANTQVLSAGNELFWCVCPNANLYIENSLPPIDLLRRYNCTITVGTDSLASNHSLSILDELKTISKNFPDVPLEELLQWATINGATALQMDKTLGSFEKGKRPGLVLIEGPEADQLTTQSTSRRII